MTTPGNEFLEQTRQGAFLCAIGGRAARCSGAHGARRTARPGERVRRYANGRRVNIADDGVLYADCVIHAASHRDSIVDSFCQEAAELLAPTCVRVLNGVLGTKNYTGAAMNNSYFGAYPNR